VTGKRSWLIPAAAVAATLPALAVIPVLAVPPAAGTAPFAVAPAASVTPALSGLIDAALHHGPDGLLPAHLSAVLGVGTAEQPTPVKQAVMRAGDTVRTFNVCTAQHGDVVLINTNERSHALKAYLVTPAGALRKAVSYRAGQVPSERPLASASKDFASEIKFWTDFAQHPQPRSAQPKP
jgi:hypothetical protein